MTIESTVEAFDQDTFKSKLAQLLGSGITPADIILTLAPGSVVIVANLTTTKPDLAQSAFAGFEKIARDSLVAVSDALGVRVSAKAVAPIKRSNSSGKKPAHKVWPGVVAAVALAVLVLTVGYGYVRRISARKRARLLDTSAIVVRKTELGALNDYL